MAVITADAAKNYPLTNRSARVLRCMSWSPAAYLDSVRNVGHHGIPTNDAPLKKPRKPSSRACGDLRMSSQVGWSSHTGGRIPASLECTTDRAPIARMCCCLDLEKLGSDQPMGMPLDWPRFDTRDRPQPRQSTAE